MTRILLAVIATALTLTTFALTSQQSVSAQAGPPPVCVTLAPGEYTFTAPAQDREGEVSFTVTIGEGGQVTEFVEPGGQSIPPSAMLQIFTGEDAYPLPEGVAIVECGDDADAMMDEAPAPVCLNLPAGTHTGSVSAGGASYDITMHIRPGGVVDSVEVLGQTYSAQDALALLEGFGATLPRGVEIVPCASVRALPTAGSGGLADENGQGVLWSLIAVGAALTVALTAFVGRRRALERRTNDQRRD